jgi:thiol-disulfide isomerase/thioredoxin
MDYTQKYLKYKNKYLSLQKEYNELIVSKKTNHINGYNVKIGGMGFNTPTTLRGGSAIQNDNKISVILFKADWCGHCKHFKPTWDKVSEVYNKKFNFITYDADKETDKFKEYKVDAFPTVIVKNGSNIIPYDGDRTIGDLNDFLSNFQ